MRVAIVSDIHGNRHAFEAVLDAIEASECRRCGASATSSATGPSPTRASTGPSLRIDLPGRQPRPRGPRELALGEFSRGAALAAQWTRATITEETRHYLESLEPAEPRGEGGAVPRQPPRPDLGVRALALQAELCLDAQTHRVCFIGH